MCDMNQLQVSGWNFWLKDRGLPDLFAYFCKNAQLVEEFELKEPTGEHCFCGVGKGPFPDLVLAQSYYPDGGFNPGYLFVPETGLLFAGAGERLLCYDISVPVRLSEEHADLGFWRWDRTGDHVIMSAEVEFAVWSTSDKKLWSIPVEPPWEYSAGQGTVTLEIFGRKETLTLGLGDGKRRK